MKMSVAFTLNNIEEIRTFFEIIQMYWVYPDLKNLDKEIKNLRETKEGLEKEIEELRKRKNELQKEISSLEAKMTQKPDDKKKEFLDNFTPSL